MEAETSPYRRRTRTRATGWALAAALFAVPLTAQEPADSARAHVVRSGDTLWDLARRYLGDPFRWMDIYDLNRDRVGHPDLILPAWRLRIPGPVAPMSPAGAVARASRGESARTVFFESERRAVPSRLEFDAVSAAPLVTEGDFHRAGMLLPEGEVTPVGTLVELVNPSVVPLEIPPQIGPFSRVYLTLAPGGTVGPGDRLHLLRPGRLVEPLGRIFQSTGSARVLTVEGEVAMVEVEDLYHGVRVGDLAVPLPAFEPVAREGRVGPAGTVEGTIVAFEEPHSLQSLHDLAFVDLGTASGVEEGDELVALLPAEAVEWGMRPEIVIARLRVVRAAGRTAAVKVIGLEHPSLRVGLPVRLVAQVQ